MADANAVLVTTVGELVGSLTVSLALERAQTAELRAQLAQVTAERDALKAEKSPA